MARTRFVIITDDFYNELEEYSIEILEGNATALKEFSDYALELAAIVAAGEDPEPKRHIDSPLGWIFQGAMLEEFRSENGEIDEDLFYDEIIEPIEITTQLLGRLMIPVDGDGYDAEMNLGRLGADQIPDYSADQPQATFAGVRYAFAELVD